LYLSISLSKGSSCNVAGDGPSQWDLFVKSGIIISMNNEERIFYGMYNEGGGDCFYYSILQLVNLFDFNIITVTNLRFAIWYFMKNQQATICQEIYESLRANNDNESYDEFVESILLPNHWACSRIIVITALFLQRNIVLITNELGSPGIFKTTTSFTDRLAIPSHSIVNDTETDIYIYQHLYEKPLKPDLVINLNHFCALKERHRRPDDLKIILNETSLEKIIIVNNGINILHDNTEKLTTDKKVRNKLSQKRKRNNETYEERNIRLKLSKDYRIKKKGQQTKEQRSIRLEKRKHYRMKIMEDKRSHLLQDTKYSEEIDIKPISNEVKLSVLKNLREKLGGQFLDEGVCIVCDRITARSCLITKSWYTVKNELLSENDDDSIMDLESSDEDDCHNNTNKKNNNFVWNKKMFNYSSP